MSIYPSKAPSIKVVYGDIPGEAYQAALSSRYVAIDIETSGLDWRRDRIGTCQVHINDSDIYIVMISDSRPPYLSALVSDTMVKKVLHHSMFDLRFMRHWWQVIPSNIWDTKISSKILDPHRKDHSLKDLAYRFMGVSIDKSQRMSDWTSQNLTRDQLTYAAKDVMHLFGLMDQLKIHLHARGGWSLAERCFDFIPTRVELDIRGNEDVFNY